MTGNISTINKYHQLRGAPYFSVCVCVCVGGGGFFFMFYFLSFCLYLVLFSFLFFFPVHESKFLGHLSAQIGNAGFLLVTLYVALRLTLTHLLTPCSRVLEKLTISQPVKKFPHFMGPEGSLPHSQVPATCPYPEPAQSSLSPYIPLPEDPS